MVIQIYKIWFQSFRSHCVILILNPKSCSCSRPVPILSLLSSILLLKVSINPLLLYSLNVQNLTCYLILFLFSVKLIKYLQTYKKNKRHISKHTYFPATFTILDSHHTLFSNQSVLFTSHHKGITKYIPHSLLHSSLTRISKQGKKFLMKIHGYSAQNSAQSHSWNSSTFQLYIYIYTCVWKLLVTITILFLHKKKFPKIQFQGCLALVTVAYVNLQSYTMFVISYMVCKFVFIHQNQEGL